MEWRGQDEGVPPFFECGVSLMKLGPPHFTPKLRHLMVYVKSLWPVSVAHRPDDTASLGDLDRLWRAECEEMSAILRRQNPGQALK